MKKGLIALSLAALVAVAAVPAYADNATSTNATSTEHSVKSDHLMVSINPSGKATIQGKVTAVSSSSVSVASWGGTWTANIASGAQVHVRGQKLPLSSVRVGDSVIVTGQVSQNGLVLNNASIRDLSLDVKFKSYATSSDGKTYTVILKNGETLTVSLSSSSASTTAKSGTGLKGILNSLVHRFGK